jgi:hypothetical protein
MLGMTAMYYLAKKYTTPDPSALIVGSFEEGQLLFKIGTVDQFLVWFAQRITSAVTDKISGRHFFCANSEGSGSSGLHWVSFVVIIDLGQHGAAAMANAAHRDDFFGDVSDPEEDAVYDKKDQILSGVSGALNDDDSFISGDHTESVTNSDCDSADWKDITESDLDSQTLSDLESQSFLPDGHDIALPSEDELRDNCGSDSDEGLIDRFEPQHLDFSND